MTTDAPFAAGERVYWADDRNRAAEGTIVSVGERFAEVRVTYAARGMAYKAGDKAMVPLGRVVRPN